MNFDFYFKRTSFRTMTTFYKSAFKPFFEQWRAQRKGTSNVLKHIEDFARDSFPGLLDQMSDKQLKEFCELVKLLVFSHRHNKNDSYLENPIIDFAIVREPMYKYSKNSQERFFDFPVFAFLFAWFAQNPLALEFAKEKFEENPDQGYPVRMLAEVKHLGSEALKHLHKSHADGKVSVGAASKVQMARNFEKYLFEKHGHPNDRGCCSTETTHELSLSRQPSHAGSSSK